MSDVKPVAWMHDVVDSDGGDPDLALSFYEDSFPFCDIGFRSAKANPLYSQATIDALQAEIESMRQKVGTGRAIIIDLLDQIDSLQSYELTRDLEGYKAQAIWDSAIENAKRYAAIAKEKQS